MTEPITIAILGKPVPWARTRGNGKRRYKDPKVRAWQEHAALMARQEMSRLPILTGPVSVTMRAIFEAPPSWSKKKRAAALTGRIGHTSRPDLDNLVKIILDAVNGIIFTDDAQVNDISAFKCYGPQALVAATFKALPGYASSPLTAAA